MTLFSKIGKKFKIFSKSKPIKPIPIQKSKNPLIVIASTAATVAFAIHIIKQKENRGENPYAKSFIRPKYKLPPLERIIEDIANRDYDIPPVYTISPEVKFSDSAIRMEKIVRRAQHRIAIALSLIENSPFKEDKWDRVDGNGGGVVRFIQDGKIIEKGGVNITVSHGVLSKESEKQMIDKNPKIEKFIKSKNGKTPFFSASISSVIHPKNPNAPTVHFNYRYFEIGEKNSKNEFIPKMWWFGGGCDLTPSELYEEDCKHFHLVYKSICEKFRKGSYKQFKNNCDKYFYIPYRKEHRGIGGVFFDGLTGDKDKIFEFIEEMADGFIQAYIPILLRRCDQSYTDEQKEFQEIRRGRYAEFNIAIDRGTKFGRCRENANIEAIHISLPLKARFEFNREIKNSKEEKLMKVMQNPVDWVPLE